MHKKNKIKLILGIFGLFLLFGALVLGGAGISIGQIKNQDVLLRSVKKVQSEEVKILEKNNKSELKAFKFAQEAREKEWRKKEVQARHEYFEAHPKGAERREYVQDFLRRREIFRKELNDELQKKKQELSSKVTAVRFEHAKKLKDFKDCQDSSESACKVPIEE